MLIREVSFEETLPHGARPRRRARDLTAALLRLASRGLDSLALRLDLAEVAPTAPQVLEFYADAGAPEGALYVNGRLVGHVMGVTRL